MKEGLVSIITPCYNGAKYISETIESVLSQTYKDYEMIIVNDGSKDNSEEIINEYLKKDSRIKYIKQANAGAAAARNNGIRNAEGQYIALLDADDVWHNDFLEKQIKFLKDNNAVVVCSAYERMDENSNTIGKITKPKKIITSKDMHRLNHIGCLTGLYDCKKYGKVYLREELGSIRDDYAYWIDIVEKENKAYGNQEALARYRVLSNSTTGNKKKLIKKQYIFYRTYLKQNPIVALKNLLVWGIRGLIVFR